MLIVTDVHEIWSVQITNYLQGFTFTSYMGRFLNAPIRIKRKRNRFTSDPQQTPIYMQIHRLVQKQVM
jgi:hypothetical protein